MIPIYPSQNLLTFLSTFLGLSSCSCIYWIFQSSELMLLGFISLLLTATSSLIANICIPSKFYDTAFAPCTKSEVDEETESNASEDHRLLMAFAHPHSFRRMLNVLNVNTCKKARCLSVYSHQIVSGFFPCSLQA